MMICKLSMRLVSSISSLLMVGRKSLRMRNSASYRNVRRLLRGLSAGGVLLPSLFDASDWTDYSKGVTRRGGSYYASRKKQEH
jgi:hypothetical protein